MKAKAQTAISIGESSESLHLSAADVAAINEGVADILAGRVHPWEDVKKEMQQRLTDAKKNRPGS